MERSRGSHRTAPEPEPLIRRFEEAAYEELIDILVWYYEVSDETGNRFAERLAEALRHISEFPRSVPVVDGRRRFRIRGFPYGIFVDPDSEVVLGFRHDGRDPRGFPTSN